MRIEFVLYLLPTFNTVVYFERLSFLGDLSFLDKIQVVEQSALLLPATSKVDNKSFHSKCLYK